MRRPSINEAQIVFDNFKTPEERLRISEHFIENYGGHPDYLALAKQIVDKQKTETPDLAEADYQLARIIMRTAYKSNDAEGAYDRDQTAEAVKILERIKSDESVREKAHYRLMNIALSFGEFEKAKKILADAKSTNLIPENTYQVNFANILFEEKKFSEAIAIYEKVGSSKHPKCVAAYAKLGRVDKLLEVYDAYYTQYPSWVRENASLAYLINASRHYGNGRTFEAKKLIKLATRSGISPRFLRNNCSDHCDAIKTMFRKIRENDPPVTHRRSKSAG